MDELNLKRWTIFFVKNKDVFEKKLESYEEKDSFIYFNFKDKQIVYLVSDELDASSLDFCKNKGLLVIVCKASRKNLNFLIDNWVVFKDVKNLSVIFADVDGNHRLIIKPQVHNFISDDETLRLGLESLYNNIF